MKMDHAIGVCSPPLPLQRQLEIVQIMVYLVQVSQTFHESGPQVSVALPETVGVLYAFFFSVPGVIGTLQAIEVIKIICGLKCILEYSIFHFWK